MAREQDQIGTHDPGYRSAGAHEGNRHVLICHHETGSRCDACDSVEEQISERPESLLDVVPEDPQEPHVEQQVPDACMEEHADHPGQPDVLARKRLIRQHRIQALTRRDLLEVQGVARRQFACDCRVFISESVGFR